MQTQSYLTQTPFFQGFPLPKQKHKEEFWVSSRTEVPVFAAETPSQMLDKGGEDHTNQLKANTLAFEEIPHLTLGDFYGFCKFFTPALFNYIENHPLVPFLNKELQTDILTHKKRYVK